MALLRGELDGRANNVAQLLHRNPDWVEKDVMDIHAILIAEKEPSVPRSGRVPEMEALQNLKIEPSFSLCTGP